MNLLRPVTMIAGLAVLLINTGDCVNLAFADAKSAECCLQEDCPLAAADQMDSCCENPVSPAKYIQGTPQKSLTQPSVTFVEFPAEVISTAQILDTVGHFALNVKVHAPPGSLDTLSIPLLI
jgi:hypothetical protein